MSQHRELHRIDLRNHSILADTDLRLLSLSPSWQFLFPIPSRWVSRLTHESMRTVDIESSRIKSSLARRLSSRIGLLLLLLSGDSRQLGTGKRSRWIDSRGRRSVNAGVG